MKTRWRRMQYNFQAKEGVTMSAICWPPSVRLTNTASLTVKHSIASQVFQSSGLVRTC